MFTTTNSAVIGAFCFLRPRGICPAKDVECEKISCFLPHGKKRVIPRYCDEKRERAAPNRQERTCRTRLIAMTALTMLFGNSAENSDNPASSLPHRKKRVKPRYSDEEQGRAALSNSHVRQVRSCLFGRLFLVLHRNIAVFPVSFCGGEKTQACRCSSSCSRKPSLDPF